MVPKDLKSRIDEMIKAVNQHDLQRFLSFYSNDCIIYDPQYSGPMKGHDALRKDFEDTLKAFPDMQYRLVSAVMSGNMIAFEAVAKGTHKGNMPGSSGPISATNRTVELPMAGFLRINDEGLIIEEKRYFDIASLLCQVGQQMAA